MPIDKDFYNEASATKLGWDPSWFGEKYYDEKLVRAVKKWQKQRGLSADGLVGPVTFRRVWTERQSSISEHKPENEKYSNYIVYNGNFIPIEWEKMVLWSDEGGLKTEPGNYYDYTGRQKRRIRYFVNHWDVCLNSRSCQRVLDNRGISVHFLIDNDGTIYQTIDMQHACWHAGSERANRASVGVEISNAYYPKYQDWYVDNGYGERPIVSDARCHGEKLEDFTDFYPVQIEALKALWKAIHNGLEIPYNAPLTQFGNTSTKYEQDVKYGTFEGFVSHYHVSKNKIDCAGLDIKTLLQEVENEEERPTTKSCCCTAAGQSCCCDP
jgi:peptidoglycan hydrolase-like protein with peptidoglycan-binding domain